MYKPNRVSRNRWLVQAVNAEGDTVDVVITVTGPRVMMTVDGHPVFLRHSDSDALATDLRSASSAVLRGATS